MRCLLFQRVGKPRALGLGAVQWRNVDPTPIFWTPKRWPWTVALLSRKPQPGHRKHALSDLTAGQQSYLFQLSVELATASERKRVLFTVSVCLWFLKETNLATKLKCPSRLQKSSLFLHFYNKKCVQPTKKWSFYVWKWVRNQLYEKLVVSSRFQNLDDLKENKMSPSMWKTPNCCLQLVVGILLDFSPHSLCTQCS